MKPNWSTLKNIISAHEAREDQFLSLINVDGKIVGANATMIKTLHLQHPSISDTNFYDLLHPVHQNEFKRALLSSADGKPVVMEAYIKNGYYHPMKWHINSIPGNEQSKTFLCVGHKIIDDSRLKKFNQLGKKNYQLIVEGLNAGIFFQDRDGELIATNQKAAEIFNTSLERLYQLSDIASLWETVWDVTNLAGETLPFKETPFMRAIATGKPQAEVLRIRLRNGEYRWLHFSSQPLFEDNKDLPYSVVSNMVDVTLEKQLTNQLEERDALLKGFMEQTPNLAWVVDENSNLVFGNEAFYKFFGINEKDAINCNITELITGSVAEIIYARHVEVLETGVVSNFVEKGKWANGNNFVFHISIFPIHNTSGKKLLGGQAVNVSDKYENERKLRETNNRLLLLTRATSDAIWEWDMQSGTIFRNDALMDMIGYHADAPKGLSWWLRRIHPDDRNRVSDRVKESTEQNQQSWQEEYLFKCADGLYKHMRDKGYIVYENGLPVKMIGSLQDISSVKELETQLMTEKLNRQKEISETILRTQEKERTRIGHELHDNVNQILSTTKLFVDMLAPVNSTEKELKKKSIDYILMAIEEIRKLSKELVVPQLTDKNLVESIETLIADIHFTTPLEVKFTHDYENEQLSGGKKITFLRIVQEQLKNILKHSKAKNVEILLQTRDTTTMLVIKDNGVGFVSGQTHRGIGLSNIYERSNFYNGTVEIQTEPGRGCTLIVKIPTS